MADMGIFYPLDSDNAALELHHDHEDHQGVGQPAYIDTIPSIDAEPATSHAAFLGQAQYNVAAKLRAGFPAAGGTPLETPCVGNPPVRSGMAGAVIIDRYRVARVTEFSVSVNCEAVKYVSSATLGWVRHVPSLLSGGGTISFRYEIGVLNGYSQIAPQYIYPGFAAELLLVNWAGTGVASIPIATVSYWHVRSAVFTDVSLKVDTETGDVISGEASWVANSPIHPPGFHYGHGGLLQTYLIADSVMADPVGYNVPAVV